MSNELVDKVAIITGGASGIGSATAEHFLSEGARVVIADVNRDRGEAVAAALGPQCAFKYADVACQQDVSELITFATKTFGALDIMFNNAGVSGQMVPSLLDEDFQDFDRVVKVDLLGVMLGTQIAARYMKDHGGGSVINTTSIGGLYAGRTVLTYRAAKAGVVHFTKSAAIDLGEHGIRVNCIAPGGIPTPLLNVAAGDGDIQSGDGDVAKAIRAIISEDRPLNRSGAAIDIANAAVFLGSERSRYVTGVVLPVDGGMTAGNPRNALAAIMEEHGKAS
ncbi:MAG TPA: glucose 1-dehydrogenase [Mycobacterium sp.]|jgi:NAD(P)-dependent dehydrogenase (short-subunit alcohol dehydrogenase family)|nr:glucose 1-dehydrogenase [Mycobacterium sp.]